MVLLENVHHWKRASRFQKSTPSLVSLSLCLLPFDQGVSSQPHACLLSVMMIMDEPSDCKQASK